MVHGKEIYNSHAAAANGSEITPTAASFGGKSGFEGGGGE
jgi:hypothetical protein